MKFILQFKDQSKVLTEKYYKVNCLNFTKKKLNINGNNWVKVFKLYFFW